MRFHGSREFVVRYQKIRHLLDFPPLMNYVRALTASESLESLDRNPLSFTRLHSLRLFNLNWNAQNAGARLYVLSQLHRVKSLDLNNVDFECICNLVSLLDAFPSLSELNIESCRFKNEDMSGDIQRQINLRRLTMPGDCASDLLIRWLRTQTVVPVIEELVVPGGTGLASDQPVNELVSIAGSSLRHLRFGFGWIWPHGHPKPRFDLSSNDQLQTLEVTNILLRSNIVRFKDYAWLPDMLQRNPSRRLKRTTLHLHYETLSQLDDEGLKKIDEALGGTAENVNRWRSDWRAGLEELEFVLWPDRMLDEKRALSEVVDWIEGGMPRAAANGVLKCYYGCTYSAMWTPVERFSAE
ncbi:unnamed protein product [Somion occarium]|uniref:Uncharacterized protein n=1 Tax=Somion occarium TaxID=3059160 RepID=A0ABP1DQ92_9APHY